tara:strand:- start:9198 stop:10349 length:1152 start_codon:yes stop_codon:yes gene_type:complete
MKTIGLVISVYDKVDELEILLNLAEYIGFIKIAVVCESDGDITAIKKLNEKYDFIFQVIESAPFTFSRDKFQFYCSITPRVWEAQRQGLLLLSDYVDYVMHTHSDGWLLDKCAIQSLIGRMSDNNIEFAYRGTGFTFQNLLGSPTGSIDDHFYIVKSKAIKKSIFIKKALVDYLPGYFNIHGILASWIICEFGLTKSLHYDDTRNWTNWDGSIRNYRKGNPLRSYVFNPKVGLLHCHADDFPEDSGRALQAHHLSLVDDLAGNEAIDKFIGKYGRDFSETKSSLLADYNKVRSKLNLYLDFDEDYKNIKSMKDKIQVYENNKLASFINNFIRLLAKFIKNKFSFNLKHTYYPEKIVEVYQRKGFIKFKAKKEIDDYTKILDRK